MLENISVVPIKDSYDVIKDLTYNVYVGLSFVFPQLPAYVAARKAENLLRICKASQEKLKSAGISVESQRQCTLKLGLPWIEWASLEEDTSLQELWANLLANALNPNEPVPRIAFLSIIRDLSSLDAQVLDITLAEINRISAKKPLDLFFDIRGIAQLLSQNISDIEVCVQNLKRCALVNDLPIRHQLEYQPVVQRRSPGNSQEMYAKGNRIISPAPYKFRLTELGRLFLCACVADAGQTG